MFVVHAEATHVFRGVWVCLWQITLMERLIWDRVNQRSRATFGGPEFPDPITQISRFDLGLLYQFSTVQGKATNCRVQNMTGSLPVFFSFPANSSFTGARRVNGVQANWYVRRVLRVLVQPLLCVWPWLHRDVAAWLCRFVGLWRCVCVSAVGGIVDVGCTCLQLVVLVA